MQRLDAPLTLACPAFPTNGRTVYQGHLFVGPTLLSDSPMKDHPLTPMRDSNLVRVLQRQTRLNVGLVPFAAVDAGVAAIHAAYGAATRVGHRFVIVDALQDRHLIDMGTAAGDHPLITGGSGVAMGLPAVFIRHGLMKKSEPTARMAAPKGRAAIIAGSCSAATRGQVQTAEAAGLPAFKVDPLALAAGRLSAG